MRTFPLASLAVTALVSIACYGGSGTGDSATVAQAAAAAGHDPATVQHAIDSTIARFAEAMKRGDTTAMLNAYTDDAIVMPANAPVIRSRADHAKWNAGMSSQFTVTDFKTTTNDLIVSGDYAIEQGAYRMTLQPKPRGKAMNDVGKYLAVWKRQPDGSWKMIRDIFNSDMPAGN